MRNSWLEYVSEAEVSGIGREKKGVKDEQRFWNWEIYIWKK